MGLIERDVIPDLELGYNAILGFPSKNGAMTIMEACRLEKISEQDAVRMLHVQVCSLPVSTSGLLLVHLPVDIGFLFYFRPISGDNG